MIDLRKLMRAMVPALMVGAIVACSSEKKESTIIIAPKPVETPVSKVPTKMDVVEHQDTVKWLGKVYKLFVKRAPADSTSLVTDEQGRQYFDNLIRVRVVRPDGSEFFNRVFSKSDFNDLLDEKTRKTGVLLGVVKDRAEGEQLRLAASVGAADVLSDEYIPLLITVTSHGDVSFQKDTKLDVVNVNPVGHAAEEEEEGV
ncbi:MAG: DUF4738 domain-containing protein [Prevotella sp.]|nr:DUF4738 domain-containing protein [Prevotella sp.]